MESLDSVRLERLRRSNQRSERDALRERITYACRRIRRHGVEIEDADLEYEAVDGGAPGGLQLKLYRKLPSSLYEELTKKDGRRTAFAYAYWLQDNGIVCDDLEADVFGAVWRSAALLLRLNPQRYRGVFWS